MSESSNFTVLSKVELEGTGKLLHDLTVMTSDQHHSKLSTNLRLGSGTDTGHGETDVDGGTDTTEEELSLQEDLTVGDRNDLDHNKVNPGAPVPRSDLVRTLVGM